MNACVPRPENRFLRTDGKSEKKVVRVEACALLGGKGAPRAAGPKWPEVDARAQRKP